MSSCLFDIAPQMNNSKLLVDATKDNLPPLTDGSFLKARVTTCNPVYETIHESIE